MKRQEFRETDIIDNQFGLCYKTKVGDIYIMWKWEEPFIRESIREICKKVKPKSVLELGFGYGYTAEEFQKYGVEKHTIVEAHPDLFARAKLEWLPKFPKVKLVNAFWQDYDDKKEYDLIYDDCYEVVDGSCSYGSARIEPLKKFNFQWYASAFEDVPNAMAFPYKTTIEKYQPLTRS